MIQIRKKQGQGYRTFDGGALLAEWCQGKRDGFAFSGFWALFIGLGVVTEIVCAFFGVGYIG